MELLAYAIIILMMMAMVYPLFKQTEQDLLVINVNYFVPVHQKAPYSLFLVL